MSWKRKRNFKLSMNEWAPYRQATEDKGRSFFLFSIATHRYHFLARQHPFIWAGHVWGQKIFPTVSLHAWKKFHIKIIQLQLNHHFLIFLSIPTTGITHHYSLCWKLECFSPSIHIPQITNCVMIRSNGCFQKGIKTRQIDLTFFCFVF